MAEKLRLRTLPASLAACSVRADWPQGWAAREALSDTANYGLLLRFEAALTELRAFRALSQERISPFVREFAAVVQKRLAEDAAFVPVASRHIDRDALIAHESWDRLPTLFAFLLRHPSSGAALSREEAVRIYTLMRQDPGDHPSIPAPMRALARRRFLPGQPVTCGQAGALRLSLDVRHIVDAVGSGGRGGAAVIADALALLDKAALLVEYLAAQP